MTIRLSGMVSGLDTESIIEALTSAYSYKKDKYVKAQTKLSWKQDAWKTLNSKVYSLYTSVGNLRYSSAYTLKKSTVSDSTKATVTASSGAVTGTQSLKIKSLATSGYLTGSELDDDVTTDTTLLNLGYKGGSNSKAEINVTVGSTTKTYKLDSSSTLQDMINDLADAGLSASYDTTNHRMYVNSKTAGSDNDFSITAGNTLGYEAIASFGLLTSSQATEYSDIVSNIGVTNSSGVYDADGTKSAIQSAVATLHADYVNIANVKTAYNSASSIKENVLELHEAYTDKATAETNISDFTYLNAKRTEDSSTYNYGSLTSSEITSLAKSLASSLSSETEQAKEGASDYVVTTDGVYDESATAKKIETALTKLNGYYSDLNTANKTISNDKAYAAFEIDTDADWGNLTTTATTYTSDTSDEISSEVQTMVDSIYSDLETNGSDSIYSSYLVTSDDDTTDETSTKQKIYDAIKNINGAYSTVASYSTDLAAAETALEDDLYTDSTHNTKSYAGYVADFADYTDDEWVQITNTESAGTGLYEKFEEIRTLASDSNVSTTGLTATKVDGSDAEIELNGVTYTGSKNSFTNNGLTIEATAITGNNGEDAITITTDTDTSGLYDKVKEFLSSYNSVINEMMELYNADSASDYEPLTDDEKSEMSDTEIEKWEQKIKDSLLRRDSTLGTLITTMTSAMMQTYDYNGKTYSWSSFGISTLGYLNAEENENYAYHIDGDSEDSSTSGNTDKLLAALASDPDSVIEFMKNVTTGLYKELGNKMQSTAVSSIYTVYNDKEMASEYSDYTTLIKTWTTRISDMEDSYYDKFAAMESALATLQSNSSSISSLLG